MGSFTSLSEATLGNTLHVINLLLISAYGLFIYHEVARKESSTNLLDPVWLETGFCEPDRETPYWTTHDRSCYTMLTVALFGLGLRSFVFGRSGRYYHDDDEQHKQMKAADHLVFYALLGALGHAAGHALIANAQRFGVYPPGHRTPLEDVRDDPFWMILAKLGPGYPLFWIPLVRTYMHHAANGRVALVALVCMLGSLPLPVKFGFAYTQSVLFAGLSLDQLLSLPPSEKGFAYCLWPVMTVIPSALFSWIEATGCTTHPLMVHWGGHVVYDAFMASSYLLFYLVCWLYFGGSSQSSPTSTTVEKLKST